jgi:hypothetical protein
MLVTESSWVPPLGYQSEGPFLVAAYQSLTGIDAYYWFATGEEDWRQPGSANGFMPSEGKWVCATPMLMGQWPAAALMYRRGYVQRGEPAVVEERPLEDLWNRRMPIIAEDPGYDPNRDRERLSRQTSPLALSPMAYFVGPVRVKYGGEAPQRRVAKLATYLDEDGKLVKSNTGQLVWDYGKGICTLNAPKAQGATGFLKKEGVMKLGDVELQCGNDYATVLAVAMDDKPLKDSGKILVQVGTTERPAGWETKPVQLKDRPGEEVVSFGHAPWMIVKADVSVVVNNSKVTKARILDANGVAVRDVALEKAAGGKRFRFPGDALYVVLEGER